jgi:hypothetical protein
MTDRIDVLSQRLPDDVTCARVIQAFRHVIVNGVYEPLVAHVPWFWTLAFGYMRVNRPTRGYAATRQNAMAAFSRGRDPDALGHT